MRSSVRLLKVLNQSALAFPGNGHNNPAPIPNRRRRLIGIVFFEAHMPKPLMLSFDLCRVP